MPLPSEEVTPPVTKIYLTISSSVTGYKGTQINAVVTLRFSNIAVTRFCHDPVTFVAVKKEILVLCTGNSCRSQMAAGFLRLHCPDCLVYSAGIETHGLNPFAVAVMMEVGVDISQHTSNHIDEYAHVDFDLVITVCDNAREACPVFPGAVRMIHQDFDDPSHQKGTPEQVLPYYRKTRDAILNFVKSLVSNEIMTLT